MRVEVIRPMIQGRIHRVWVTSADLHYVDSVTIDRDLLDTADIAEGQCVDIADIDNDKRLSTYTITGPRGFGAVQLNGAAAHLVNINDLVTVMMYCQVSESQMREWKPVIAFTGGHDRIIKTGDPARHVPEGSERTRELGLKSAGKP